jgi:glycosyltransferase involved in cell wall biosynthesis
MPRAKLAIVATHPIQYYAPWFAYLADCLDLDLRVFYLWDFGVVARQDPGFGVAVAWDVPLLEGYSHEFVQNLSPRPGTNGFFGLWNPGLRDRLLQFGAQAVLLTTYNCASVAHLLLRWMGRSEPLLFRGDSHRLVPRSGFGAEAKRRIVAAVFRRFAAALYVGAANRAYFRLHGTPAEKLFYSPHAVDNQRFFSARQAAEADARAWRASLGIPEHSRVILFAGKLDQNKRPLDLLRAFQRAHPDRSALLFVGDGPLQPELRAAAAGVPSVFFAPFQNQSSMPRVHAAANVLVLPSESETWGLVVNEAMCLGRPAIVSSHVGCAHELVLPNETGLVFPAGDVVALGEAIRTALDDEARLRSWGENAARRVREFGYRQATDGLVAALQSVGIPANWKNQKQG